MLTRLLGFGKLERKAIQKIESYLNTLLKALKCLKVTIVEEKEEETYCIENLEREADVLKREIIAIIYEGAFLPYVRPSLCTFIETIEKAFEFLKVCAVEFRYLNTDMYQAIKQECTKVADLNVEMGEVLISAFNTLKEKADIREKNLAIRVCEKKIDEIKHEIMDRLRRCDACKVVSFWEGKDLSDFVEALVSISDVIEDASDYLYILELSLK